MLRLLRTIVTGLCLASGLGATAHAAGTTPLAMAQQTNSNGQPLAGCLLYFYQAGTVATPQNAYSDFALSLPLSNPASCDQNGRVPMHWLADGLIHIRLTDSSGVVQVDTTMQTLGPSSGGGGGGGGGSVDSTTVASTGDVKAKFSNSAETSLAGWVILNGTTIGSATSGATQRANSDTQNLFVYLWNNCASPGGNVLCTVSGGQGGSALADFNANKTITVPDLRGTTLAGRDCMLSSCRGFINNSIQGVGNTDLSTQFGGNNFTTLSQGNIPAYNLSSSGLNITDPGHHHTTVSSGNIQALNASGSGGQTFATGSQLGTVLTGTITGTATTGVTISGSISSGGSGTTFNNMPAFILVTYYIKL